MHSMAWLVQLAQLVRKEQGVLQGRALWLCGLPEQQDKERERQTINSELCWSQNKLWPSEFLPVLSNISSTTSSSCSLSLSPAFILSHRQVFHRWGRRWWPCRGWLWDRPRGLAPGRRRSPSRWALRAAIAGWCWWRVTCPPSPSTTRWSSSGRPRETTSAGMERKGGETLDVAHAD